MPDIVLLSIVFLLVLLLLYFIGVPVAFALGLTAALVMLVPAGPHWTWDTFVTRIYSQSTSFTLLAVPFFLLAGRVMNDTGMTDDVFNFAEELVGPLPGGLGHVNVVVSIIFSGMSGAAIADAAGLGAIEYKAMTERDYDPQFAVGITGASSIIGPIIPPSIPIIIYGVTATVSIGALFIAGIIPGLILGLTLMIYIYIVRRNVDEATKTFNLFRLLNSALHAIPAFLAPVIVVGGILAGLFTPTEAAVVTSIYSILVGFIYYRTLTMKRLGQIILGTFEDSAALILIIAFASIYGYLLTISGIPQVISQTIVGFTTNKTLLLILIAVFLLILGTFMETIAIILIIVPILAPILPNLGIDLISFGIIMLVTLMIGTVTPPFGVVLFALDRVTDLDIQDIIRGVLPFYIPLIIVLLLLIIFPGIITFLPNVFNLGGI